MASEVEQLDVVGEAVVQPAHPTGVGIVQELFQLSSPGHRQRTLIERRHLLQHLDLPRESVELELVAQLGRGPKRLPVRLWLRPGRVGGRTSGEDEAVALAYPKRPTLDCPLETERERTEIADDVVILTLFPGDAHELTAIADGLGHGNTERVSERSYSFSCFLPTEGVVHHY